MTSAARPLSVSLGEGLPALSLLRPDNQDALLAEAVARSVPGAPDDGAPYALELWPSSVALARFLVTERVLAAGVRVLELGCGLGLTGIAAARVLGARVTLTDACPRALALVREAVSRNAPYAHEPAVLALDWRSPSRSDFAKRAERLGGAFPVVLAADVLYAPESHEALAETVATCLAGDGDLYLADPGRRTAAGIVPRLEAHGLSVAGRTLAEGGVRIERWRRHGLVR